MRRRRRWRRRQWPSRSQAAGSAPSPPTWGSPSASWRQGLGAMAWTPPSPTRASWSASRRSRRAAAAPGSGRSSRIPSASGPPWSAWPRRRSLRATSSLGAGCRIGSASATMSPRKARPVRPSTSAVLRPPTLPSRRRLERPPTSGAAAGVGTTSSTRCSGRVRAGASSLSRRPSISSPPTSPSGRRSARSATFGGAASPGTTSSISSSRRPLAWTPSTPSATPSPLGSRGRSGSPSTASSQGFLRRTRC
mmetsp:Transcript_129289/g.361842  ORF Transcript_129289/g.361842 Transcript_129289/m.361842 type:complete len:250 (+) Transcript_129289:113-862(+)